MSPHFLNFKYPALPSKEGKYIIQSKLRIKILCVPVSGIEVSYNILYTLPRAPVPALGSS